MRSFITPSRWAPALLGCGVLFFACHPSVSDAQVRKPNIIFLLADDLGYGDLGCYGQKSIQTPNLDKLAAGGRRYTQFYAGSTVCAPSRCSLMTGLHTGHCFIRGNGKDDLRPDDVTIAEVLKPAGYATALIGKWGLGHEGSPGTPNKQGFDYFFGYLDQHHAHNYYPSFLIRNERRAPLRNVVPNEGEWGQGVASKKVEYSHDLFMEETLQFVDQHRDRPFFLYLAMTIPHANNEARKERMEVPDWGDYADKDWLPAQKGHAAMITRMDRDIGRLVDRLQQHGILNDTLIFFSSDNGPHAEGGNNPNFFDSNGPLKGIKRDLTEGGIRVPAIAYWPKRIPAGTVSEHIGAFWDLMPTFAAVAGAEAFLPAERDGISFLPDLTGNEKAQAKHESLYWAFYERGGGQALRMGKWKAVQQPIDAPIRLYDLEQDLGETTDLAAAHPEIVETMKQRMVDSYVPSERWVLPKGAPAKRRSK